MGKISELINPYPLIMKILTNQSFPTPDCKVHTRRGFSFVEILAGVSIMAVLVTGGIATYSNATANSEKANLVTHTKQLNSAIQIYEANGGQINSNDGLDTVLAKLKTAAAGTSRSTTAGLRGAMVDSMLKPIMQSSAEASTREPRIAWNGNRKKFVIKYGGPVGIKAFRLRQDAIPGAEEVNPEFQTRFSRLKLAKNSNWLWDYGSFDGAAFGGPTQFSQSAIADLSPDIFDAGGGSSAAGPAKLQLPLFSLDGGDYDYRDFNLAIELINPNEAGSSTLIYAVGSEPWADYTLGQQIAIAPNEILRSMAITTDSSRWIDSDIRRETYISSFVISGDSSGEFYDPTGTGNTVTNVDDNLFEWGEPYYYGGYTDPSWILFNGTSFADVSPDERFEIGTLTYYNGTIFNNTDAKSVQLDIGLEYSDTESLFYNYEIALNNVADDENAYNGDSSSWASADYLEFDNISSDYIYLDTVVSSNTQTIGDTRYELYLEFGETTDGGQATSNSFHVLEEATSTATVYGTIVETLGETGGSAEAVVDAIFNGDNIIVNSTKDLSNVVLLFVDRTTQKYDGLTGYTGTFWGTGDNLGKEIIGTWVKSGSNGGPGSGNGEFVD